MSFRGESVLVTGGDGFVGSRLCMRLLDEGAVVTVIVRDRNADSKLRLAGLLERVNVAYGDVADLAFVMRVMNEYGVRMCFHLAAQTLVGIANRSPLSTFESNIKGTWTVLEAVRLLKLPRLVVASSDKAYGSQGRLPYSEDFCLAGVHPYDVSKSCADLLARSYAVSYGVNVAISRCSNIYGPGDTNWSRIVPGTFRSIIKKEAPVIRSDGTLVRDYLFVDDAVEAYLALADALSSSQIAGEAFNFGTNKPVSVIELVDLMLKVAGSGLKPVVLNEASNEIAAQYMDSSKAARILGWRPKFSVEAGLRLAYEWYKSVDA